MKLAEGFERVELAEGFEPATEADQVGAAVIPEKSWRPMYDYVKSGKYIPDQERTGFVMGAIEAMGFDVSGVDWDSVPAKSAPTARHVDTFGGALALPAVRPTDDLIKLALGKAMSIEDAEKELVGRMDRIFNDDTLLQEALRMSPEALTDISVDKENSKRKQKNAKMYSGLYAGANAMMPPGVAGTVPPKHMMEMYNKEAAPPVDLNNPDEVSAAVGTELNDRFNRSPADVFRHATSVLTKNEQMIMGALVNGARGGGEQGVQDVVNTFRDELLAMPAESYGWVTAGAMSMIPETEAAFIQRILPSATAQLSNRWRNTFHSMRNLGGDLFGISTTAERIGRELESRFKIDDLLDDNGAVRPETEEKAVESVLKLMRRMEAPRGSRVEQKMQADRMERTARELLSNFGETLLPAYQQARLDRMKYGAKALAAPQYNDLGWMAETALEGIGTAVDMAALAVVAKIPVIGVPLIAASTYGSFQGELEQRLVYDHGMSLSDARMVSGIAAVPYAIAEYSQVGMFGKAPNLLPYIGQKNGAKIFMHSFANYYRRALWPELREEYIQAGIEFAALETARVFYEAEGIEFSDNIQNAVRDAVQATAIMPFVTAAGGGASSVAMAVRDKTLSSFVPHEFREAFFDIKSPADVYESSQKARRTLKLMDEQGVTPNQFPAPIVEQVRLMDESGAGGVEHGGRGSIEFYAEQNEDGTFRGKFRATVMDADGNAKNTDGEAGDHFNSEASAIEGAREYLRTSDPDLYSQATNAGAQDAEANEEALKKFLEAQGYEDSGTALDGIRLQMMLDDAKQEMVQARVQNYQDNLSEQLSEGDETDVFIGPKMGLVQGAMDAYGTALGITTETFATQEEAVAAHPELAAGRGQRIKAVNLDGRTIVMVEENLDTAQDAIEQWWHEAGGHRGLDINPKAQRFLDGVKNQLGIDFIKSQVPAFYHEQSESEIVAEYLSRLVGRAGKSGTLGESEQEKSVWAQFKQWVNTEFGLDLPEVAAARNVAAAAQDILAYAKRFDVRYPEGTTVTLERRKYTRRGGQWIGSNGKAVKAAGKIDLIQNAADEQIRKAEAREEKARNQQREKQIQAMMDGDPVLRMVMENGGIQMPEVAAGHSYPDEYAAIPKRFRGKKGQGLPLDEMADQVAALSGQEADYSTSELRAYLERFEEKVQGLESGVQSSNIDAEEQVLLDQLKRGEIDEKDFERAMADLTGARFSVAGEKGVRNLSDAEEVTRNLDVAREMETAGKDASAIRIATGWERGAAGKWRYELPDILINVWAMHDLKDRRLGDVVFSDSSTELFTAYPKLKNINVAWVSLGRTSGRYDGRLNTIALNKDRLDPSKSVFYGDEISRVMLHEIQHAIQEIEGFAQGTDISASDYMGGFQRDLTHLKNANTEYFDTEEGKKVAAEQEAYLDNPDYTEEGFQKLRSALAKKYPSYRETKINEDIYARNGKLPKNDNEVYRRAAGEVEARNVAARMNLMPEERRAKLLRDTEDVAREDQILLDHESWERRESDIRFSVSETLKEDIEAALNTDRETKNVLPARRVIEFSNTPDVLRFVGVPDAMIISEASMLRKMNTEHHLSADDIAELPDHYSAPVMVFKDGESYVVLTDEMVLNHEGVEKPVMVYLKPKGVRNGKYNFIASAYSRDANKEVYYAQLAAEQDSLLYMDKERAALLNLEEATWSRIQTSSESGSVQTPESFEAWLQSPASARNETSAGGESQVRFSVAPAVESEAFKKWFGDSKVVDEEGNPRVVYHGTSHSGFSFFDVYSSNYGLFGVGIYTTEDAEIASQYTQKGRGEAPGVYPLHAAIKNPIDMDAKADRGNWETAFPDIDINEFLEGETNADYYRSIEDVLISESWLKWDAAEFIQNGISGMGFDGITHIGGNRKKAAGKKHRVWIAFNPEQIKSIYNQGTFDPENPDIRFSAEQRRDPYQAAAVYIAGQIYSGEFNVKPGKGKQRGTLVPRTDEEKREAVREVLNSMGALNEKYARFKKIYSGSPDAAVNDVLYMAKNTAASTIQQKNRFKNNAQVSRFIRDEASRQWFNSQVEKIHQFAREGGEIAAAAEATVRYRQELAAQAFLTSLSGMGWEELREYGVDVRNLLDKLELKVTQRKPPDGSKSKKVSDAEFEKAVNNGTPIEIDLFSQSDRIDRMELDQFFYRVRVTAVRKLQKSGELNGVKLDRALRTPAALAEFRETLKLLLRQLSSELTYGFRRDVVERRINSFDGIKLGSTMEARAATLLQQIYDAKDFEALDAQVAHVLDVTKQFSGRLKYRLQEISRTVDVRAQKMFRHIRGTTEHASVLFMEPDAVQAEMERLRAGFDSPDKFAPEGVDVNEWMNDAIDRYNMLKRFGGFKYKTPAERADAVNWLDEHIETELKEQEERRAAVKEEAEKIQSALLKTLPRLKNKGYNVRSAKEWWSDVNSKNLFLEMRLEHLPAFGQGADQASAKKMMSDLAFKIAQANFQKNNNTAQDNVAFGEALKRIYGTRFAENELKALMTPREEFRRFSLYGHNLSRAQMMQMLGMLAQQDIRSRAETVTEIDEVLRAEYGDVQNALKNRKPEEIATALWQSTDDYVKYRTKKGGELSAYELVQTVKAVQEGSMLAQRLAMESEMIDAVRAVSAKDFELLNWFRDYYRQNRPELSRVNKEITGFVIDPPDALYIPAKVDYQASPIKSVNISMPVVPPSLTPRVFNRLDLDEQADIVSIYMRRLESNQHFINFAGVHQQVAQIFNDSKLTKAIELTHGKQFSDQLGTHLRDTLSGQPISGGRTDIIDSLVNFFSVTRLGWNLSMFPKQMTGLPAFAMYVKTGDFLKYVSTAFTPEGFETMREILNSPHSRARRREGFTQVDRELLTGFNSKGMTFWEGYKRFGRFPTEWGDIMPTLLFGQGYYRAMLDDAAKQGMKTEEAKQWAMDQLWRLVEISQQSGAIMNLAEWQRHGGSFGRAMGQFLSTPSQFWAKQTFDWRAWRAAVTAEGGGSARARAAGKQFAKTTLINHVLLAGLFNVVSMLWRGLLGEAPDEKDFMQLLESIIVGPWSGVLVVGAIQEGLLHGLMTGESGFGGGDLIPIAALATDAQTVGAAVNAALYGDWEEVFKELDKILKGVAPVYRDASKAIKNYGE